MNSGTGINTSHILLLEDDRAHQDLVLRSFRDDPEPFRVTVSANVREARQVIDRDPPDLIIADWILPDGKGLDILPRRDGMVTIPLVIMTSFGDEHLAVEIMKSGAIDYVVKSATMFRDLPHIARRALRDWEHIQERIRAEEAEQESRKRLADIIGFLPDAMLAIDNDGRVIAWNDTIERMTGVAAKDMIGKGDHEYSIPFYGERRPILIDRVLMDDDEAEEKYDDIQRDEKRITSETFIPTLYGGKGAYLWGTALSLFDNAGNRIGAIEVIRDITERKRVEVELQAKESQLSTIYRNVSQALYFLEVGQDNRYRFLSVNQPFLNITGLTQDQVVGKYVQEVIPEPSLTLVLENYKQAILENTTVTWEEMTEYPTGIKWGDVSVTPLFDTTGRCTNLVGSVHDITERKRAEEKLQVSEERYRNLFASSRDAIFLLDEETGSILDANGAACLLYGYSHEELVQLKNIDISAEPDETQKISNSLYSLIPLRYHKKKGGAVFPVEISVSRFALGDHKIIIAATRDITERQQAEEKLRESEERYRALLFGAGIGVGYWSTDGTLLLINEISLKRLKGTEKDFIGKSMQELFGENADAYLDRIRKATVSPDPMEYEDYVSLPVGNAWYLTVYTRISRPDGSVMGIQVLSMEITGRKQAEEKLRNSEKKYHRLYDSVRDAFASVDMGGRITLFNEPFQKMVGYGKEEIYNLTYNDLTPDKWHTIEADIVKNQVLTRGYSEIYEKEYRRKDGTVFPVELRTFLIKDDYGNPQSMSAVIRDITERKKAEEALRDSEEKYRNLAENVHDGVYIYDGSTHFMFVNHRAADITGFSEEELLSMNILDIVHPDDHTYIRDIIAKRFGGSPAPDTFELHIVRKDGIMRVLEISVSRITYRGQFATLGAARDITDRKRAEEKLQESEIKYRELVDHLPIGIGTVTFDGNPLTLNDAMYRITGTSPETIQETNTLITYVNPEDRTQLFQRLAQERVIRNYEVNLKKPDGTHFYANLNLVRFISKEESIVLVMMEDISEKKKTEEALRQNETRFRALIQNSSDIIRILNREGRIVYESDSAERILGYPPGHLIGSSPMEYIHPDDLERVKNDFRDVLDRTNTGTPIEFRIRKADGEYIWVNSLGTNLLDIPGVNGVVITTRPIQQRKEAEQALKENQARLATAMDIAGLANWEFDVASGMFTFDDRFYALYGTTADREGGNLMSAETYMQEFVYPDDRPAVIASIQNILATTDPDYAGRIEHRITPRDGGVRTIIARFAPVMGPDGKVIRTYGANQDITDLKLMEAEIRSLNTSLEQRVRDRTEALARTNEALKEEIVQRLAAEKRLQASFDEKVTLLKEIHHRVKNNLQIITSLLNLQSRYIKDKPSLEVIRESQNRIKAMALVHEKLYRAEDISHISLSDYIRFLGTGLFQFYDARSRGIQFTLDIRDINVDIDAAIPLGLIMNELISNSLKYAFPEGRKGEIAISVKKEGHTLTVVYRDTGIGIPAELDWRDTQSLGLRLVNTLVDQLNGTVELDRSAGTAFTMVLHEKEQRGTQ